MKARSTIGSRRAAPERATAAAAQRIVTAARQHFFAHGFRGVTMDDLAAELGMAAALVLLTYRATRKTLA